MTDHCLDCGAPNEVTDDHDFEACVRNLVKQRDQHRNTSLAQREHLERCRSQMDVDGVALETLTADLANHVAFVRRIAMAVRYWRAEECGTKLFTKEVCEVFDIFQRDPGAFKADEAATDALFEAKAVKP